jgi:hypothetical protein
LAVRPRGLDQEDFVAEVEGWTGAVFAGFSPDRRSDPGAQRSTVNREEYRRLDRVRDREASLGDLGVTGRTGRKRRDAAIL